MAGLTAELRDEEELAKFLDGEDVDGRLAKAGARAVAELGERMRGDADRLERFLQA